LWRRVWVALAEAQHEAGLVTAEQAADLKANAEHLDIERSLEIEGEIHHDLMAELRAFAEQCPTGGPVLHLGATSTDIEDNADALRLRKALELIQASLRACLGALADQIDRWAATPAIGFTHLQPAEPTTVGYRLAQTGQDLLNDWQEIERLRASIRGKGFKGAVGTSASFTALLNGSGMSAAELEARALAALGLEAFPVSTQTYPRKQDWLALNALAGLAGTLYKFAFDLRLLQSPLAGEWREPFATRQVGSSAMPFKRNPINAEKIDSLARFLAGLPRVAWDNAAHSLLERTLDDSANRRTVLPEAFLAADELLAVATRLIAGLQVDIVAAARNLEINGPFAGLEPLLMALARAGADRQAMHERLRQHALRAAEAMRAGTANLLADDLARDSEILRYLEESQIRAALDSAGYLGDAPRRTVELAQRIRQALA
jgi:adenylosuccinate lyase